MENAIAVIGALSVLMGAIASMLGAINQSRAKKAVIAAALAAETVSETALKVDGISVQVDGRLSTLLEFQSRLIAALHASGTPIPDTPPE